MRFPRLALVVVCVALSAFPLLAQSPNGNINGLVLDPSNQLIVGAEVIAVNDVTAVQYTAKTNNEGVYVLPNLPPGPYRVQVSKVGFKTIIRPDIVLNVQGALSINFTLPVGATLETVTIQGGAPLINTESAAVSTVVDRQFAEDLPLNGRSFQTLIQLTPGIVSVPSTVGDSGQFSVNGQRAGSNYWMIDGVSANAGISPFVDAGNGLGGSLGTFSVLGGTNSLVSVDAMQEFRVQTSTYAPEFGRTPGGQISIVTRSGTNRFHGTVFDYFRNDALDANDWFADSAGLPRPEERQNDFGGTFSGPIRKDRAFFFFSYEGLRLRLPQVALTDVPSLNARQSALPVLRPYLSAFPLPNGPSSGADQAQYNASFSNRASLDAYSIRVDHRLGSRLNIFGRYNYSPSELLSRGSTNGDALSELDPTRITAQTVTGAVTLAVSPSIASDLRVNFSRTSASSRLALDNFGGAVPLPSLGLPDPYTSTNANLFFDIFSLADGGYEVGKNASNLQRQINAIGNVSIQEGSHSFKFGVDFRRLSPVFGPFLYGQNAFFNDVPSAEAGNLSLSFLQSHVSNTLLLRNLGAFAQDTWRVVPRLTMTYGVRWDVDFAPSVSQGPELPAATGFKLGDLSQLALAPAGTLAFRTSYSGIAPRFGAAYQISDNQNWGVVARGGVGIFFDLASQEIGTFVAQYAYPFGVLGFPNSSTFPLDPVLATPPPITPPDSDSGTLLAFDPNLRQPYTVEWNFALEQGLGKEQSLSASYVGAGGRRLTQTAHLFSPNSNYGEAILIADAGTSDYHALQLQFQRRLSRGLQAIASYSWSHSIDDGSAGSTQVLSNALSPGLNATNRGASDFDIRNAFSTAVSYALPSPDITRAIDLVTHGWSIESVIQARSAPPVDIYEARNTFLLGSLARVRPDLIPGIPVYLYGRQYPGGRALNFTPDEAGPGCTGPFCPPPLDSNGHPLRQGTLRRNSLRAFGATQWDLAIHRDFPVFEVLKLQFRAEMFNVLNHPNFGPPQPALGRANFGLATQMLGRSLSGGNVGGGAFSPLYQIGGPRSIQLALKLIF